MQDRIELFEQLLTLNKEALTDLLTRFEIERRRTFGEGAEPQGRTGAECN